MSENPISTPMEFKNYKVFRYTLAGRPLVVETGKMAGLANGSCLIRYGETAILCCATASVRPRDGIDFLPLSVDYDERMYAAGKIPGGYLKREGKPSEKAVLTSRVIDRPIRPLFPKDLRNDVALTLTVMSVDPDCSPEITAMIGASIALSISDIPWNGPIGGVLVGLVDGKLVINPNAEEQKKSDLQLTVAATTKKVVMIEAGANEVSDETMYDAIMLAHREIKDLLLFINAIIDEIGKPKFSYPSCELDHEMFDEIFAFCEKDLMNALDTDDKSVRDARVAPIYDAIVEKFSEKYPDLPTQMEELLYKMFGINAELLIDHAWGYEPVTIADIRGYKPETNSIGSGQVLHCPYDFEKTKLIVREMTDALVLDLVEKQLVTDQIVLDIGYDIENLTNPDIRKKYHGEVKADRYGRFVPKHAHGTANLDTKTSSTAKIMDAVLDLYERIVDKNLLVRRVSVTANRVVDEHMVSNETEFTQMDLFTDYQALAEKQKAEQARMEKERRLQEVMLSVKKKYGKNAMLKGTNLQEGATMIDRNNQIGGHRA